MLYKVGVSSDADPVGSVWRRWDPHIHTPGTVLSDQFGDTDPWESYLQAIEDSSPRIEAVGVTDYASIDRYCNVLDYKNSGRLPDVGLIFPNIELRFDIGTSSNSPINFHLLVSPEDPDHVDQAKLFLRKLTFMVRGETYACVADDLVRLGRVIADDPTRDAKASIALATNQLKISVPLLRSAFDDSRWAQENIIVGLTGGSTDGSSGLQKDSSFSTMRREIESIARVIFSAQPSQRSFWLGKGVESIESLERSYGGRKLCLHGSDAHRLDRVGMPDQHRYTWIKGDATFESLRQACLEPETRAIVGEAFPEGALRYKTVAETELTNAPWCKTPRVPLNSGLVAIIGARGSGKTALADLIAKGAYGRTDPSGQSFVSRAGTLLADARISLQWGDGSTSARDLLDGTGEDGELPQVQYLTQQFVERLCSAEGLSDELLVEIERVIFEAHPAEERYGTTSFRELLDLRAARSRAMRRTAEEATRETNEAINEERELLRTLPGLQERLGQETRALDEDREARSKLIVVGGEQRARQLEVVTGAMTRCQARVDELGLREQSLEALVEKMHDERQRVLPNRLARLQQSHLAAGLTNEAWQQFDLVYAGHIDSVLGAALTSCREQRRLTLGEDVEVTNEKESLVSDVADLDQVPLRRLKAESDRLRRLIGLDQRMTDRLNSLSAKIASAERGLSRIHEGIKRAESASGRLHSLITRRNNEYGAVFDGISAEAAELSALYRPLEEALSGSPGALGKLAFSVRRVVDLDSWVHRGEELMDLRKQGKFRGHGQLRADASSSLLPAWEYGTRQEVSEAMALFRRENDQEIVRHCQVDPKDAGRYQAWGARVAEWLTSTDHIDVRYGIQYDGVDIERLSPGTRGIVLLLLYLSIDTNDDRPLIVDQPEENLDPKSIYGELVHRFRDARTRRQVIIVTHNANLVINTDADQVIVAEAGAHVPGSLPDITYRSGGLENPVIRELVCEILEGGRTAFQNRAKRLHMNLE